MGNGAEDKKRKLQSIIRKISPINIRFNPDSNIESLISSLDGKPTLHVDINVKNRAYIASKRKNKLYRAIFDEKTVKVSVYLIEDKYETEKIKYPEIKKGFIKTKRIDTGTKLVEASLEYIPPETNEDAMNIIKEIAIRAGGYRYIEGPESSEVIPRSAYIKKQTKILLEKTKEAFKRTHNF